MTSTNVSIPAQALLDQRARYLNEAEDIVRTHKEFGNGSRMKKEEADRHAALMTKIDAIDAVTSDAGLENQLVRGSSVGGGRYSVPNINLNRANVGEVTRNLDAILWATDASVKTENGAYNAVEKIVVRSDVGDVGVVAPRINEFRPEHREMVRAFQDTVADMAIFGMLIDQDAKSSKRGFEVARSHRLFRDQWDHVCRAMDVDTTGEGAEWVPTGIGASMHEKVRASGKVAALFAHIDLPSNPWKWPMEGGDITVYRVAEPTSDTATKVTASTPGTGAVTFDAEILGARSIFSRSIDADSAMAIIPFHRQKMIQAFVDAEEKAILDGDTDGTHMDSDTQSAGVTHASSSWDGLRKRALAETTQATTTTSAANLALIRKAMKKWGVNPTQLAFIIGVSSYSALMADSNLITVDKFGPNAVLLNGQIGSIYGVPVIVSEHVREDLNASGVYDGITTTKTYALCVNRNTWALGTRMPLDIAIDDSIYRETFQRVAVAFCREDLQSIANVSTDDDTSVGYNITSGS